MAEFDVKAVVAKLMSIADTNNSGKIEGAKEGGQLARALAGEGLTKQQKEQTLAEIMGFQKQPNNNTIVAYARQRRAASANTPVIDNSVNIKIDLTMVNDIQINLDTDKLEETINNLFEKFKQYGPEFIEELVTALVFEFQDRGVDLTKIETLLESLQDKMNEANEKIDIMTENQETMISLIKSALAHFTKMGLQLEEILNKQDKSFAELAAIYDALVKLEDTVGKFDANTQNAINNLANKFGDDIGALVIAINALKEAGNKNTDKVVNAINKNTAAIQDLSELLKQLDIDVKTGFEEVVAQVIANGGKLDDIKELLIAMKKDIGTIKADTKESKEIQKEILAAIKALGADSAANFTALLNAVNEGNVKLESLKGILTTIKNYTEHIDGDLHEMNADQKLILEGVNIIIEKIGKGEPSPVDPQGPDYTEILNLIYDKLSALKEGNHNDLMAILSMIGNRPDIDLTELYNLIDTKGDEIIAAIKDHDVHVTVDPVDVNVKIDPADINVNVECHCTHGQEGKNEGIIDAEGLIDAGVPDSEAKAVFDFTQVLSAKRRAIAVDDFNTTAIKNVQEQQEGLKGIFDLAGRPVQRENMVKGNFYIVDGRKVLYK